MKDSSKFEEIKNLMKERILILDGAMGTRIGQKDSKFKGLAETLLFDNPELIREIHREYLEAGADIIKTNSFNSSSFSLSDYGLEEKSYEISREAARLARETVEQYKKERSDRPIYVAGSVGPTKFMLSVPDSEEGHDFDEFANAYATQINGLLDGGADIILVETAFDTLNVKAALYAVDRISEERNIKIPVMVSCTIAADNGSILSGQNLEAFSASVSHGDLISMGFNCGFGSAQVLPFLRRLNETTHFPISVHTNAGLPNEEGEYLEKPDTFVSNLREGLREGLVNIIGGCCGTTPEHIRQLAKEAAGHKPRKLLKRKTGLILSNRDIFDGNKTEGLIHVGERTNMAGSAKFARLIREKKFDEAREIASTQIRKGAHLIDICMDDGLENAVDNMLTFLEIINGDAEISRVPLMIDSSDWKVISAALKVCQGRSIVNSISLKEGEKDFLEKAKEIRRLGAVPMVMLFDEKGQAETHERKIEIAERAYRLLREEGFNGSDIIIDPNVLTVGTGLEESDTLAKSFITATEWIKRNLPGVHVSGGISNLSFAYRGNNPLRSAMHSVFIYHAVKAGLDMAIVNSPTLKPIDSINPELIELIEDLLLCRRSDAASRLSAYAVSMSETENDKERNQGEGNVKVSMTWPEKIERSIMRGQSDDIKEGITELLKEKNPMEIIETVMMPAMEKTGELFRDGKMFLPQVIRSAQTMKKAMDCLVPLLKEDQEAGNKKRIVIATVKGDVHDIGKNIVGLVASCNGYEVKDLGVRVEASEIATQAEATGAEAVLLSGLISPSLNEMTAVCEEFERRGLKTPIIIGGAATSAIHTAVCIAPKYSGPVFYSSDANANMRILHSLTSEDAEKAIVANSKEQEILRKKYEESKTATVKGNRASAFEEKESKKEVPTDSVETYRYVNNDISIEEVEPFIEWKWLLASFDLLRRRDDEVDETVRRNESAKVKKDAEEILHQFRKSRSIKIKVLAETFTGFADNEGIIIRDREGGEFLFRTRQTNDIYGNIKSLVGKGRRLALFATCAGFGLEEVVENYRNNGDDYSAILAKLICDRLAEATAQWLQKKLEKEVFGEGNQGKGNCLRVAIGYPAIPDHTLKKTLFELTGAEETTGMRLTETNMIVPSEAVCGLIIPMNEN